MVAEIFVSLFLPPVCSQTLTLSRSGGRADSGHGDFEPEYVSFSNLSRRHETFKKVLLSTFSETYLEKI